MKSKTNNDQKTFTREQLYKLVWSESIKSIALQYKIPECSLKSICKDNDIPLPQIGYWSKIKYNKEVLKAPLPKVENYKDTIAIELKPKNELSALKFKIESELKPYLIVPEKLTRPCDLIKLAKTDLKTTKPSYYWDMEGYVHTSEGVFDILVSKELVKRALLFSNTLIKLIKKRGHQVVVREDEEYFRDNGTQILIDDESFRICVRETRKRTLIKGTHWDTAKYSPSGILTLRIEEFHNHMWQDTTKTPIEKKLAHILAYLELRAIREKKERIAMELGWAKAKKEREIEEKIQQKRGIELANFKQLITDSKRWQKTIILRNYINQIESNAKNNDSLSNEFKDWLTWAKQKADWYDPLIEREDELLDDINRETLSYKNNYNW